MAAWQPASGGSALPTTFGGVLPSLAGSTSSPSSATRPPPRQAPTVAPAPTGPPGETGTPPRTAFAAEQPATSGGSSGSSSRPQRFGTASVLGACVIEAAIVVPTLHVEVQLAQEPWSLLLRILIATVRLYPIVMPCISLGTRMTATCGARWHHGLICRRLAALTYLIFVVLFRPEVRWGIAITLDMWYLLTTPLNRGLREVPCVILLVANIILCFVDTLTLIMMLAVKSSEELDQPPERENFARPRPVKLGQSDEAGMPKFDPTCIICLSDFKPEDEILQLPCNHTFHTECITKWLSRSRHCPLRCPPVVLPPRTSRAPQAEVPTPTEP
uniref:RING-type domain-containing protein n=1 Tax=Alexandrium catenella TaxID=2925 RepID=A0A7S1LY06_ALECA|mmetsp:Transcript_15949/g.43363  ORF Transcript_15949/g.43363 Transcript_15949/m.43363 type:complete len:330 (+) Transcript_15949:169-1158(+)